MNKNIILLKHPILQHKLSLMRQKETDSQKFRSLLFEISTLLAFEATRESTLIKQKIETPLQTMEASFVSEQFALISILRAGNGILEGMLKMLPNASVGHIGIYRNPVTLEAVEYYFKIPSNIEQKKVILVDPMLATAHSAIAATDRLKNAGAKNICFICILSAPKGIANFQKKHPQIKIYTVAIDDKLNEKGYILPGLGDAGDRIYNTK